MGGTLRTVWLIGLLSGLMALIGFLVAAYFQFDPLAGTLVFLALAAVFNVGTLFWGDKLVLRAYRAKVVSAQEAPRLHRIIDNLVLRSGMPKPQIAVIPTENPNAFATGRSPKHATVAATIGILQMLDDEELEGVMAHELAHVQNRDMLVMTTAATIAGAISFAARMFFWGSLFGGGNREGGNGNILIALLVMITAPIAAMLVQLSISRTREYKADATGARMTGKPWALANALRRIEQGNKVLPLRDGNPAHSSLFIANPFRGGFSGLFATHPPMEKRIQRLERLTL